MVEQIYTLMSNGGVIRQSDGAEIPPDPKNRDWQQYQEWLAEGNEPKKAKKG